MQTKTFNSYRCFELGEEGRIYFNARYYDPEVGRFLTEDPSRKGTSWYTYCNNNPLTFTDPTGRQSTEEEDRAGLRERWQRFKERVREIFTASSAATETASTAPATAPTPQSTISSVPQNVFPSLPAGALSQNDPALAGIAGMGLEGCYFRACQMVAEADVGQALTASQISAAVTALQSSGALGPDMSVSNPDVVISDAFARLGRPGTTATVNWGGGGAIPNAALIKATTPLGNPHWRYGDIRGNVTWDPYSPSIAGTLSVETLPVYIHRP